MKKLKIDENYDHCVIQMLNKGNFDEWERYKIVFSLKLYNFEHNFDCTPFYDNLKI